jgi:hypothetical protein
LAINISLEILEKKRKMQIAWYAHSIWSTKLLTTFLADGFFNENSLTWNTQERTVNNMSQDISSFLQVVKWLKCLSSFNPLNKSETHGLQELDTLLSFILFYNNYVSEQVHVKKFYFQKVNI